MKIIVRLTPTEVKAGKLFAIKQSGHVIKNNTYEQMVYNSLSQKYNSVAMGALAERSVSIYLGAKRNSGIGTKPGDLAGFIEVRSGSQPKHHLNLNENNKENKPYVWVVCLDEYHYDLKGWAWADDIWEKGWWLAPRGRMITGMQCLNNSDLRPMYELDKIVSDRGLKHGINHLGDWESNHQKDLDHGMAVVLPSFLEG